MMLSARPVNPNFAPLGNVQNTKQARTIIADNVGNNDIYLKPTKLRKVQGQDKPYVHKILKAFHVN